MALRTLALAALLTGCLSAADDQPGSEPRPDHPAPGDAPKPFVYPPRPPTPPDEPADRTAGSAVVAFDDFDPTPDPLAFGTFGKWPRLELTWALRSYPEDLAEEEARAAVASAFATWAASSALRFEEVQGEADIAFDLKQPGEHGDVCPFASSTIAHAFYPDEENPYCPFGEIHFNEDFAFGDGGFDFETVALHEVGHALGLQQIGRAHV